MELTFSELENGIRLLKVGGELDAGGVGEIERLPAEAFCSNTSKSMTV